MDPDEGSPKGGKKKKKKGTKKDRLPPKIEVIKKEKKRDRLAVTPDMLEQQLKKGSSKKKKKGKKKDKKKDRPYVGVTPDLLAGKPSEEKTPKDLATPEDEDEEEAAPLLCPDCGAEVPDGAKTCPECDVALAEGEEIVCAVCGSPIDESVGVCLICGTRFMSKEDAAKETEVPIEDFVHHRRRDRKKAVVRMGKEPEKAERPSKRKAVPKKRKRPRARVKRPPPKRPLVATPTLLAIIIIIIVLLIAIFAVMYPGLNDMDIDGNFDEWGQVVMHKDIPQTDIPENVNIVEYAVQTQDEELFLYLKTKGEMFPKDAAQPSYVNVFIDSDSNPDTGYMVNSIGAEHRIEVKGWTDSVRSAKYFTFSPSGDANDWNAFVETGNIQAASSGNELEISKSLSAFGLDTDSKPSILFTIKTSDGDMDITEAPVGTRPGGISVTQYIKAPSTPVAPGTGGQVFMNIKVEAKGVDDTFRSMTLSRLGTGTPGDISSITLWSSDMRVDDGKFEDLPRSEFQQVHLEPNLIVKVGTPVILTLKMDVWDMVQSPTVGAMIFSTNDVVFKRSPVALHTIQEEALISYINKAPAQPTVDGAWGDWNSANSNEAGFLGGSSNPDITFKEIRSAVVEDGHIKMTIEVTGQILSGSPIPDYQAPVESCGPDPKCPNTGEDVLIVYLDADSNSTTGVAVGSMGAEYAVIIQGKYGMISPDSLGFYDYDAGKGIWEKLSSTGIWAFTEEHRIEVEIDLAQSGLQSMGDDHRYMVELRDSLNDNSMSSLLG